MAQALRTLGELVQDFIIFPFIRPREAARLAGIVGQQLPRHRYVHCITTCEVRYPHVNVTPNGDFVNQAPALLNAVVAAPSNNCTNNASFFNAATNLNEPHFCVQPANQPVPNVHGEPHPAGRPCVCAVCKQRANTEFRWLREEIRLGVCKTCRTWAIANMAIGQDDCTCAPVGSYNTGVNNNERRDEHLCKDHMIAYWRQTENLADVEIRTRLDIVRTKAPKKKGHGWSKKKQHGPRPVRTPIQRRAATRLRGPGIPNYPEPRCYCGEHIGAAGHVRMAPGGAAGAETGRVRNCAGCNNFKRNW